MEPLDIVKNKKSFQFEQTSVQLHVSITTPLFVFYQFVI